MLKEEKFFIYAPPNPAIKKKNKKKAPAGEILDSVITLTTYT